MQDTKKVSIGIAAFSSPAVREDLLNSETDLVVCFETGPDRLVGHTRDECLEIVPPEALDDLHRLWPHKGGVVCEKLLKLNRALLCDKSIVLRNGTPVVSNEFIPGYIHNIIPARPDFASVVKSASESTCVEIDDLVFAPLHPWCKHYGHFLLEGLPRLALIKCLWDAGVKAPIYIDASAPKFILDFLELLHPDAEVLMGAPRTYYRVQKAIIPNFDPNLGRMSTLRLGQIQGLIDRFGSGKRPWRKLFTYRSEQFRSLRRNMRYLSNQDELAEIAVANGFELVAPETFSVREQIKLFSEALFIAGEYSSALHNALFAPEGATIFSFNMLNQYQQSIAMMRKQRLVVFRPTSGVFVTPRGSEEREYSISPDEFCNALSKI